MNLAELKKALVKARIPKKFYSFESDGTGEVYRITQAGDRWHVYYAERGQQSTMGWFDTENDACEFFLKKILSDQAIQGEVARKSRFIAQPEEMSFVTPNESDERISKRLEELKEYKEKMRREAEDHKQQGDGK